ncbi:hypothetical protein [Priestia megaterium]|uniref:Uncharacterized protein n=1 Tax=Priestia megaterium (strain DSM 319 / IMG 1521) TaxID=592022 RepID=D5DFY4_PRIM3|nr:hypothetical protein [Priestia megaterium]ADF39261.1 hypothetical protein BMD_2415 [Priestia megaterium DSM 319]WEZ38425.1 hypothetical protein P5636_25165 [Priestia megaterium DSM 319]
MRFLIEYKDFKTKEENNFSLQLLDIFLNEHLIGEFHGSTFECILIRFINNPTAKKKYKLRVLYENIAEIELPGNFNNNKNLNIVDFLTGLHRVEEAIMLVKTIKLKSELDFSEDKLLLEFQQSIKNAPRTLKELKTYFKKQKQTVQNNWAKLADLSMKRSLSNPKPLTKPLITISISAPMEEPEPDYTFIYTEVFSNLLRKSQVMLPGYSHIFIHLADTLVEAKQEFTPNPYGKDAFSIIDTKKYMESDNETKSNMMFDSIVSALRSITEFDYLEEHKIESVIGKIKEKGTDIELTYFSKQNEKYLAEVIYTVPKSHLTNAPFKLRVTDLNSNLAKTTKIDEINLFWCPYSFGSISIKKDLVVIKGRKSQRAEISRRADKLPDKYIFNIKDIFI